MGDFTGFFVSRASLAEGMGRLVDLGDTMTEFNRSLSGEQADLLALHADWMQVGEDLRSAYSHCLKGPSGR